MLRVLAIAGGFLTITAGLLVLQPGAAPDGGAARDPLAGGASATAQHKPAWAVPDAQVSRASSGLDLTQTEMAARQAAPATTGLSALGQAVARATGQAQPATDPAGNDLQNLTASVLADLGAAPSGGQPSDELRSMTSGVLASLNAATGVAPAGDAGKPTLEGLIAQALQQGQSDAYLDALLNEAASTGQITVPSALVTSDGRVDTVTLLASLVAKSTGQTGVDTGALAAAAGGPRPAQRPATPRLTAEQVYTVRPGDSLAAISYRFYGETYQYKRIYSANQDKLSSPDKIRVGQRLRIPAL